jgi:hypothetical protein
LTFSAIVEDVVGAAEGLSVEFAAALVACAAGKAATGAAGDELAGWGAALGSGATGDWPEEPTEGDDGDWGSSAKACGSAKTQSQVSKPTARRMWDFLFGQGSNGDAKVVAAAV